MIFSREKKFSIEWFKNYFLILQGALIAAMGYTFFLIPHKVIPGGLFGLATIAYHLFGIPAGTLVVVVNIPLIFLGVKILGPRFGTKTVVGTIMLSAVTDAMIYIWNGKPLSDDLLVSVMVGGFLVGSGIALIFKAKATTGGTDIVAQMLQKWFRIPVGKSLLFINGAVITVGALAMQHGEKEALTIAIYSVIGSFVTSKVLDVALEGYSYLKGVFIISDEYEEIKKRILVDIKRGGTLFIGQGMYNDREKKIIFSAVNRREISLLKSFVKDIDPDAFIIVFNTQEVFGKGFQSVSEDN